MVESLAVEPCEFRPQQAFVEGPAVGVDEAHLVPLQARDFMSPAVEFEPRADPHPVEGCQV